MGKYLPFGEPFANIIQNLGLVQNSHLTHIIYVARTDEIMSILKVHFIRLTVISLDFYKFVRCRYYFSPDKWLFTFLALWILDPLQGLLLFDHIFRGRILLCLVFLGIYFLFTVWSVNDYNGFCIYYDINF